MLDLLYFYQHLNKSDLKNLLCMDLITHRVCIKEGTKSVNTWYQKKWTVHTEWWLQKLVQNGLKDGIYELTESINERLSEWNAKAVMINKVENLKPSDES